MIDLDSSIYGCSFVLSIGNSDKMTFSERQTRWNLWNQFRDKCLDYDPEEDNLIESILETTYPLEEYSEEILIEKWGCSVDIDSCVGDIIIHGEYIYSPIEVNFHSYHNPPLKWCDYMRKQGFMIVCYFFDLDPQGGRIEKCGKCIYDNKRIVQEQYTIPYDKISKGYLDILYEDGNSTKTFLLNLSRMRNYAKKIFFEEGICKGLCELLDLYGIGPEEIAGKGFKMKNMNSRMELLEKKLEDGEINEGKYLEDCNSLKDYYNGITY